MSHVSYVQKKQVRYRIGFPERALRRLLLGCAKWALKDLYLFNAIGRFGLPHIYFLNDVTEEHENSPVYHWVLQDLRCHASLWVGELHVFKAAVDASIKEWMVETGSPKLRNALYPTLFRKPTDASEESGISNNTAEPVDVKNIARPSIFKCLVCGDEAWDDTRQTCGKRDCDKKPIFSKRTANELCNEARNRSRSPRSTQVQSIRAVGPSIVILQESEALLSFPLDCKVILFDPHDEYCRCKDWGECCDNMFSYYT